jgi:hypothetical protein
MSKSSCLDTPVAPGNCLLVKPKGKRLSVARLILIHVIDKEYMCLTPGGEIVRENYDDGSVFIRDSQSATIPLTVGRVHEDFSVMPSLEEFEMLCEQAESELTSVDGDGDQRELAAAKALVSAPGAAAGSALGGRREGPSTGISGGLGRPQGQPSRPSLSGGLGALAAALQIGKGPVPDTAGNEESGADSKHDVRVLPVLYDRQGMRFREFRDGAQLCEAHPWSDWPVPGPRTAGWVINWIVNRAGTPLGWHAQWKAAGRLQDNEPNVIAHESACRVLECGLCYDQFDICSSASFELIARQLQICEDRLAHRFEDSAETRQDYLLMSGAAHRSQLCICPELTAWIATETQKETAVLKERRKAREERVLAGPKKGAKKGGSDG